jgi:hypothetical protein
MEFFIRQNASKPVLKLRLVDDGKNYKSDYNEELLNAEIKLDMFDVETNMYKILGGECNLSTRIKKYNTTTDEYYIIYQFSEDDTSEKGRFEGIVNIQFRDTDLNNTTKLIVPIQEKLFINII